MKAAIVSRRPSLSVVSISFRTICYCLHKLNYFLALTKLFKKSSCSTLGTLTHFCIKVMCIKENSETYEFFSPILLYFKLKVFF